ncbi:alpha/beta fold hydrolase [Jatrophihabitans sp.]|uniref:alpha/beta fold hydrolase n=1 Tax=Jatrophihabitans sp. TaxID=1932789 RepID=UPI002B6AA7FD|nr:alpha/beta fold hydrolase [Jatrophihabitans sp.]
MTSVLPRTLQLHGQPLSYADVGAGPAVLFVHGLLGSHRHWAQLMHALAADRRLIAPDLFGHGASAKPIGDYSLGAHAATLRDLLDRLGVDRVTLVGHSLGGGIAMQFCYLFPDRVDRLVLVSSGGLGRELSPLLRAAALPGAELVLPVIASGWLHRQAASVAAGLSRLGIRPGTDLAEAWRGLGDLDAEGRRAFLATVRSVIDPGGQTVTAWGHLPMTTAVPTLLVWGAKDRIIPSWHAVTAQTGFPGCRVEIFQRAGHFPHLAEPERFAALLAGFIGDRTPDGTQCRA